MSIELMLKQISEYEFGNVLLNSTEIQKLINSDNFLVAREFKVGSGVPDFVLITRESHEAIERLSEKYPAQAFRGINSFVISDLYGKMHLNSIDEIARYNFTDVGVVRRSAKKLHDLNIVRYDEKKLEVRRVKDFKLPKVEVVSLELKLDKWKKALWQASRNRAYYAKSYVVMPSDKEDIIRRNIGYFDVSGISALVVDPMHGNIKFVGRERRKDSSSDISTYRLTGLSYLMQQKDQFAQLTP